jgi:hypothetical protein
VNISVTIYKTVNFTLCTLYVELNLCNFNQQMLTIAISLIITFLETLKSHMYRTVMEHINCYSIKQSLNNTVISGIRRGTAGNHSVYYYILPFSVIVLFNIHIHSTSTNCHQFFYIRYSTDQILLCNCFILQQLLYVLSDEGPVRSATCTSFVLVKLLFWTS